MFLSKNTATPQKPLKAALYMSNTRLPTRLAVPHCLASGPAGFWLTRHQVDRTIDSADFPTAVVASASP